MYGSIWLVLYWDYNQFDLFSVIERIEHKKFVD